jgi:hypothetical protein
MSVDGDHKSEGPASRMVKKAFRQGRNERKAEAYVFRYGEVVSEARTTLEAFFNILSARLG